jgi:hypothetical protein
VRKKLGDKDKSKDRAALERKRKSRNKLGNQSRKNPVLEAEYSTPPLGARPAIEILLGCGVPENIEEKFLRVVMRFRAKNIKPLRAKYIRRRRQTLQTPDGKQRTVKLGYEFVRDVICINSFLLDVTTGERACFCIGKKCPGVTFKNECHTLLLHRCKAVKL